MITEEIRSIIYKLISNNVFNAIDLNDFVNHNNIDITLDYLDKAFLKKIITEKELLDIILWMNNKFEKTENPGIIIKPYISTPKDQNTYNPLNPLGITYNVEGQFQNVNTTLNQ